MAQIATGLALTEITSCYVVVTLIFSVSSTFVFCWFLAWDGPSSSHSPSTKPSANTQCVAREWSADMLSPIEKEKRLQLLVDRFPKATEHSEEARYKTLDIQTERERETLRHG
jgi:hypothetical protein